jgi:hypothetical protein
MKENIMREEAKTNEEKQGVQAGPVPICFKKLQGTVRISKQEMQLPWLSNDCRIDI